MGLAQPRVVNAAVSAAVLSLRVFSHLARHRCCLTMKPCAASAAAPRLNIIIALCLLVIVVGAYVRIREAGLACPDWPLCHGELLPTFSVPVFWEWLHRLLALITFLYVVRFVYGMWHSRQKLQLTIMLLIFVWQAVLGALTVTKLLNPTIVNLHFLNALLLLSFFIWFKLNLRLHNLDLQKVKLLQLPHRGSYLLPLLTGLLILQLTLGSVVAANYGGYACPALFTCTGTWEWPQVAIQVWHMLHRILGVAVSIIALYFYLANRHTTMLPPLIRLGYRWGVWLLAMQVGLGLLTIATDLSASLRWLHFVLGVMIYLLLFAATCEYLLLWRRKRVVKGDLLC